LFIASSSSFSVNSSILSLGFWKGKERPRIFVLLFQEESGKEGGLYSSTSSCKQQV
jgi:hypothetical protein